MTIYKERSSFFARSGVTVSERNSLKRSSGLPALPAHVFTDECSKALNPAAPTMTIPLDLSGVMKLGFPATTPSILANYICIRKGESIATEHTASIEFYYVIRGEGCSRWGDESIDWNTGDLFFLPGGSGVEHEAYSAGVVLYLVTDEPLLRFLHLRSPGEGKARFQAVHYQADQISRHQDETYSETKESGAINFGVDGQYAFSSIVPTWKWLKPGQDQYPHRHAPAAVQLFTGGMQCYSTIAGKRFDWQDYAVAVSPAGSQHSHHNESEGLASYLVTQDYPLHKYLRTYWYEDSHAGIRQTDWEEGPV